MRTSNLLILLAQLGLTEAGNGKVRGGFRWGDWSEWEPCVRVGKKTRRRRVCFGPIMNKKINKAHCEDNIGGSFSEQQECTQDMINQAGAGKYTNCYSNSHVKVPHGGYSQIQMSAFFWHSSMKVTSTSMTGYEAGLDIFEFPHT